jgi:hypothetical protein
MVRLQPAELIALAVKATESFKAVQQVKTLDAHADEFIKDKKGLAEDDEMFVRQVLYGLNRDAKLLKVVVSSFYFKHGHEASLTDRTLYSIFGYLAMMRLDELGWPAFERLVGSQDQRAIFVFINYLFSKHNLDNWMKPEWLKIYDEDYVDSELIGGLLKWAEPAGQMLGSLEEKVYNVQPLDDTGEVVEKERQVTVPEPFELTRPKPRMVSEPDSIPCGVKANPVNEQILDPNFKPAVEARIEAELAANRADLASKYSSDLEFQFQTASRIGANRSMDSQTYFPRAKHDVEQQREAELQFDMKHGVPLPKPPTTESAPIKLNTAAILREDTMYRKKQEKEAAMIKRYESELRDGSEFEAWQRRMEDADEEERLKEINRRRIEMALSQEQAIEARKRKVRENRVAARMQQAESAVLSEKHEAEKMEEFMQKKLLVDDVVESRSAVPEARQQLFEEATTRANEIRQESEEIERQRQQMIAEDQERKQDLIRQIKALELVPIERVVKFDPTETAGHMLLEEMSLAELKERLALGARRRAQEREAKRGDILRARKEKEDDLAQRAERLSRIRKDAGEQGTARRRDARRKERDARLAEVAKSDAKALHLQAELEKKRSARKQEDVRLAAELKEISLKKQFLDADFSKVEETKYKELEMGFEREIVARQTEKKHQQAVYERTRETEVAVRASNTRTAKRQVDDFRRDYDERVADGLAKSEQLKRNELAYNQSMVQLEHVRDGISKEDREQSLPYETSISHRETMTGRKFESTQRRIKGTGRSSASGSLQPQVANA